MSSESLSIVDTSVLMYFLLAGQEALLLTLVGEPIGVPLSIYDPSEEELPDDALRRSDLLSEMRQAIRHYEIRSRSDASAERDLECLRRVTSLHQEGRIETVELTDVELSLAARVQSRDSLPDIGLKAPLGPGEASCVAIAWKRGLRIATDDGDALKVLEQLHGNRDFPHERIRKLLIRAATSGIISRADANLIHANMRGHGFWDSGRPFP